LRHDPAVVTVLVIRNFCVGLRVCGVRRNFFGGGGGVTPGIFSGGFQKIKLRFEDRESGDLGAVAPQSGVPLNLQMNETHILIRLLRLYIPRNWEFG
jgi:hypothetical protein